MGVLNVTPDSFSDGGQWLDAGRAIAHAQEMVRTGADLVDVGGESTRPGATPVAPHDELARVLPVVEALVADGIVVSVDTMHADTARAAVAAGAAIVNDVSGGLADPRMLRTVAELGVPYVAMHWRGHSRVMDDLTRYDDVVSDVVAELSARVSDALEAGIEADRLVLDPGLGFAKEPDHNWALLHGLERLRELGRPVLVGASRKRFLGALLAQGTEPRALSGRDAATDAVSALAALAGAWCVRVHDVRGSRDAVEVAAAWRRG
jgi:dihydropteroate synthase